MPFSVQQHNETVRGEEPGTGNGVQVEYCSAECLLRSLPADVRWVRNGQTEATRYGILAGDLLYLSIQSRPRQAGHVLGAQGNSLSPGQRWGRLLQVSAPGLMRVQGCCECTACVGVIQGAPLVDANTTPLWLKKMVGARQVLSHDHPVPYAQWAAWMAGLAEGLEVLRQKGLAHGDPFPFNAVIAEDRASWVDFSHLTDDPDQQIKDLWAFLFFTVLYSLAFCAEWSPGLLQQLVALYGAEDWSALAAGLKAAFAKKRRDLKPAASYEALVGQFIGDMAERGFLERKDPAGRIGYEILAKSSLLYYSSFLEWIRIGNDARSQFELERVRHQLIESEHLRLRVPRVEYDGLQAQLHDRTAENREILAKHDWLAGERARLLAEDERKLTEIEKLLDSNRWLAGENAKLVQQTGEENARLVGLIEQGSTENARLAQLIDQGSGENARLARLVEQSGAEQSRLAGLVEQTGRENVRLVQVLDQAGTENARLVGLLDQVNAENARLVQLLEKAGEDYREAQGRQQDLTSALAQRDLEIHRLAADVHAATNNHHAMEEYIRGLNEQALQKDREIQDLAKQVQDLSEHARRAEAIQAELRQQLERARLELTLFHDRKDGYYKTVQKNMIQLMEFIEPLLSNLEAFRVSKTYKMGVLASAMRNLPMSARLSLLYRMMQHFGLRRDVPVDCPENEIILTINQLAMQMRNDINAVRNLQITRPQLPPLPAPPATLPASGNSDGAVPQAVRPAPAASALACQPLVSVLLPVYNHADMLGGAIESVRRQTYANWEIVILDDGSTDDIDAVLERVKDDPRIRIYRQQNQRLPNALTNLHQLARGEFVTWTSADNLMAPAMLDRLVQVIAEDPDTVLVYADTALIDEEGTLLSGEGYRDHNRDTVMTARMRLPQNVEALGEEPDNFINACFLYRARAARAVGAYAADLNALEDYDFFLRLRRAGHCRHADNDAPLYFYRVHRRTMSEEVLTKEREAHIRRSQQLIEYDQARGRWFERRWNVYVSAQLPREEQLRMRGLLERMPVNLLDEPPARTRNQDEDAIKLLRLLAPGESMGEDGAVIVCGPADYTLHHVAGGSAREIGRVPRGQDISWLAVKSRRQINPALYYEFIKAQERPVIGTHLAFADVDVQATIELINAHPDLFFALIDDEQRHDMARGQAIAAACANCAYLGPRKFGASYWGYTDFAAVFCPPLDSGHPGRAVRQAQQLALACGRWLLYPAQVCLDEMPPFAMAYESGDPLPQVWQCERPSERPAVLDRYLHHGSEAASLERALCLMGTALQEAFIPRPDFGQLAKRKDDPRPWQGTEARLPRKGWIGLWIDTLDRGGLEEIIALLAHELRRRGLEVRLLCSDRGGLVAGRLQGQGFPCEVFGQDAARFEEYLRRDPPLLLSTHYTQQMMDVPARLGIPIVETIHNMYIHYDDQMWENERRRSACYTHAIAVSRMVRDYYLHWHGAMSGERVTVVNNAADYRRTLGPGRLYARQLLGLDERTTVFVNVASFDGRKNQLGLVTAFERLHAECPATRLILMGNIASPYYYGLLQEQLQGVKCREAVQLMDFQKDLARVLAAADVFVIPSYFEGWSVSATEAALAGLPVIHTLCGSGPELCGEGGGYLIDNPGGDPISMHASRLYQDCLNPDPPNTEVLVSTMRCALNEQERWRTERPRLRTEATARYSVRRMVDQYLDIFVKCCSVEK